MYLNAAKFFFLTLPAVLAGCQGTPSAEALRVAGGGAQQKTETKSVTFFGAATLNGKPCSRTQLWLLGDKKRDVRSPFASKFAKSDGNMRSDQFTKVRLASAVPDTYRIHQIECRMVGLGVANIQFKFSGVKPLSFSANKTISLGMIEISTAQTVVAPRPGPRQFSWRARSFSETEKTNIRRLKPGFVERAQFISLGSSG